MGIKAATNNINPKKSQCACLWLPNSLLASVANERDHVVEEQERAASNCTISYEKEMLASVAQWLARLLYTQKVAGSIPAACTILFFASGYHGNGDFFGIRHSVLRFIVQHTDSIKDSTCSCDNTDGVREMKQATRPMGTHPTSPANQHCAT